MTKKHFEAIAAILARRQRDYDSQQSDNDIRLVAEDLANYFRSVNPNFDKARFLRAAGVQS